MNHSDQIRMLPRLEFNILVQKAAADVCDMGKHVRVIGAKSNYDQLRSSRFHSEIMRDTAVWKDRRSYNIGMKATLALSIIYEVAVRQGIKLPDQFILDMDRRQKTHVEELPKDKPSIGESFGLLKHTTRTVNVPTSPGFRLDTARSKEEFDALFGSNFTTSQIEDAQAKCPIKKHMEKHVKHALNYGASSEQLRKSLDTDLEKLCLSKRMYVNSALGNATLDADKNKEFDVLMFGHHTTAPTKNYLAEALADIEARVYATTYPAFATGEALDKLSETTAPLEKPMRNLEITKPVLVGHTDILTCKEYILVDIIRDAKEQIKLNADIAEVSTSYAKKAKQIEAVITLCVAQLDKRFK